MSDPKPINRPVPVCHNCGRIAVAYDQHRRLVCAIHSLHPYSKFNLNQGPKPGRNHPCPCGSERRFKSCCGKPIPLQLPTPIKQQVMEIFCGSEAVHEAENGSI